MTTLSDDKVEIAVPAGLVSFAAMTSGPAVTDRRPPRTPPAGPRRTRGPDKKPRRRRQKFITSSDEMNAAVLHASGVPKGKIASVLDLSKTSVDAILARPGVRELKDKVREVIRTQALANIQQVQDGTWAWLNEVVAKQDPKAFDAITRGLASLERVAASASGENRQASIAMTHDISADLPQEARDLITTLLGPLRNVDTATRGEP